MLDDVNPIADPDWPLQENGRLRPARLSEASSFNRIPLRARDGRVVVLKRAQPAWRSNWQRFEGLMLFACLVIICGLVVFTAASVLGARRSLVPPPLLVAKPSAIEFGDQPVDATSSPKRLILTNSSPAALTIDAAILDGDNASDFAMVADACTNMSLAPGKNCVIDVVMTPSVTGHRAGVVTISYNSGTATASIELSGNGINSADVPPR